MIINPNYLHHSKVPLHIMVLQQINLLALNLFKFLSVRSFLLLMKLLHKSRYDSPSLFFSFVSIFQLVSALRREPWLENLQSLTYLPSHAKSMERG